MRYILLIVFDCALYLDLFVLIKVSEDSPEFLVPGVGALQLSTETSLPISRGRVRDWSQLSRFWNKIITEVGVSSVDSTSVMFVENPLITTSDRAKWAEIIFDAYRAPSICYGNSSSLSLFASGRTSGVSLDCGAGIISAVPVLEGLALSHAAVTVDRGGQDVSWELKRLLAESEVLVSYEDARITKESMCFVNNSQFSMEGDDCETERTVPLYLPDGTEVDVKKHILSRCTDVLFDYNVSGGYPRGLSHQVYESILLCDDSLRKDMMNNIVISGGTSMISGLADRLNWELTDLFAQYNGNFNGNGSSNYSLNGSSLNVNTNTRALNYDVRVVPNSFYR